MDIQTEAYLEELADTVPEAEVMTQTDAFMDRPPTPLFIDERLAWMSRRRLRAATSLTLTLRWSPSWRCSSGKRLSRV